MRLSSLYAFELRIPENSVFFSVEVTYGGCDAKHMRSLNVNVRHMHNFMKRYLQEMKTLKSILRILACYEFKLRIGEISAYFVE